MAAFIAWLLSWIFGLLCLIFRAGFARPFRDIAAEWRRLHLLARDRNHVETPKVLVTTPGLSIDSTHLEKPEKLQKSSTVEPENATVLALYYYAAWTDSGRLLGCPHQHQTVISAANCISEAGGYVVAVDKGGLRALSDAEEKLFWLAYYGKSVVGKRFLGFRPFEVLKPSSN